jgi:hypothetical protein
VARSINEAIMAPKMVSGGVCVWRNPGVWRQAVGFHVGAFGRNLTSVRKVSHIIDFEIRFVKFLLSMQVTKMM